MAVVGEKKNGQNERLTFERIPQACSVQSISNGIYEKETLFLTT